MRVQFHGFLITKSWKQSFSGTHGADSGISIAELINGKMPKMRIDFYGA
jgi:hypothetical protein